MFYSQFILAKKGPLGTIWIAAHLERKLRKNQVADTDIGDSVDSILSPDVPIALRLSSHLLLGVVRIYSRKVNYLFHDCSEALLKIKQAFRSTVVDLPPEESTAPYHSITLPETFDLDDFELPDSALQGNYTDHHVGTREQITLQDSVDGTSYTALQFGLDERFGDGDSSQIRLVLDEDLFMHNIASPQLVSVQLGTEEGAIHVGQSSNAPTNMDIDGGENGSDGHMNLNVLNLSEVLSNDCDKNDLSSVEKLRMSGDSSRHGYNIQTPDLNQVFSPDDHIGGPSAFPDYQAFTPADIASPNLFDHAQAPATPGLLEEAVRANVQEIPALSPQEKNLSPTVMDVIMTDNSVSPLLEIVAPAAVNTFGLENGVTMEPEPEDAAHSISSLGSNLTEAKPVSLAPECSDGGLGLPGEAHLECGQNNGDHLQGEFIYRTKPVSPVSECLGGFLAATDTIHLECEQKKNDQIHSGFVCNEVSNMPIMPDGVEALCPEVAHLDNLVASSHSIQASKVDMSLNKSTTDEIVVASIQASKVDMSLNKSTTDEILVASHDNVWVPGVSSEINTASLWNIADPSFLANQEHAGDVNCCLTSTTPALGSDLYLRACNSQKNLDNISPSEAGTINEADLVILDNQSHVKNGDSCFIGNAPALSSDLHLRPCNLSLNQANLLSAHAGALVEDTPGFARSVLTCTSETPSIEQPLHVSGSSLNLQGEGNHAINITNTIQEICQKSDSVLSNFVSHAFEPDGQLTSVFSKETQPVNVNFSSSGYPEPEKVLFATNCDVNLPNDLGQITAEKGVSESTESINQNNSLTGKKHHLMDCSPLLQHSNSVKQSRLPRLKRSATYMPDDDDLLASILVGRTPTLRMGPTPVPQKAVQQKRRRLTPKVGVPKRKVLLDDTMVLHADAIRKQLVSIEDIRRMRKKAPCTRPEIWMIQKNAMEEELFSESLFTGISTELNNLNTKTYGMNENKSSQIVDHHLDEFDLYVQQSKEKERSRMESVSINNGKETGDPAGAMSDRFDSGMQRPSDISVSIPAHNGIENNGKETGDPAGAMSDRFDSGMQRPSDISVSIPAHNGIENNGKETGDPAGAMSDRLDSGMQRPSDTSVSIPAHNGIEADVLDAHKKLEPHMSQLEPSISIPAHNGIEADVLDAHKKMEPHMSQLEPSISIPAHNGIEADVLDAHKKIESHMSQLEPSINDQTITVSTTDVQGRVGVEMPLICASHSVNEIEVSTISNIEEFVHKNTEVTIILQEQELRPDLVQSSDRPIEITDRTSSFAGTAVGDAASAEDEIRCRIVDGGMQEPPVASASIVVDMPLVCSPLSGHEIGISTFSTSEKEALNIPQESKLVDDSARPSDKSMEMVDRTPNFGGATVVGAMSSEYADRDNSVTVRLGECSIPEDASISQNKSRMDVLDSNGPQYIHDVGEIENGEILVSMLDKCLLEDRAGMAADSSNVVEHANIIPDAAAEHMVEKMLVDVERPSSEVSCSENAPSVSSCLHQQNTETENVPSAVGDNSGMLECIIEGSLDVESARMDGGAARESTDLYDTLDDNDTEFLNADYEPDFDEAEDNRISDTEASLENSGWSTRTRGVARYLKTLFNEEHGRGRKTIAVDHLLAGKTRKEASRMFFETLVLRTRDYIHVEQEIPFERINIKPGLKLLKSQF